MKITLEKVKEIEKNQLTNQEIVVLRLGLSQEPTAIGEVLGVTRQRVTDVRNSAESKLRWQRVIR